MSAWCSFLVAGNLQLKSLPLLLVCQCQHCHWSKMLYIYTMKCIAHYIIKNRIEYVRTAHIILIYSSDFKTFSNVWKMYVQLTLTLIWHCHYPWFIAHHDVYPILSFVNWWRSCRGDNSLCTLRYHNHH